MDDPPLSQLATSGYDCKHIRIRLVGEDGNAASIIGRCVKAMSRNRVPKIVVEAFVKEATSGDYNNVLITVLSWFDVDHSCECE